MRDPFGATREMSTSYYLTTSVLAPGIHDYQYAFGWRRQGFGTASWDYTAPALFARHRVGLTDWLSAGVRMEAERGLVNSGTLVNLRVPVGEIEAASSVSRIEDTMGVAMQASYSYAGRFASLGGTVREATPGYRVIGTTALDVRPLREVNVFGSLPLVRGPPSACSMPKPSATPRPASSARRSSDRCACIERPISPRRSRGSWPAAGSAPKSRSA